MEPFYICKLYRKVQNKLLQYLLPSPAPATPIFKPATKTISRHPFKIDASAKNLIGVLESPTLLIAADTALYKYVNGIAINIILR